MMEINKKGLRLFFVIDETPFYHPDFLQTILKNLDGKDKVVGTARVTAAPAANDIERYIRRNWRKLYFSEILVLVLRKYGALVKALLARNNPYSAKFYSVVGLLKAHKIPYFDVQKNINRPEILEQIRATEPDIIISSNSLIFGKELLAIPTIACINRHSALLPSYGGVWPVFQAFRVGEKITGASVHLMEPTIDTGVVLSQEVVPITENSSLSDLYEACFNVSSIAVLKTLDKLRHRDLTSVTTNQQASYFTFPTEVHWQEFRARGGRFV